MVRVDWVQPALDDLREVYEFIARDSRRYARLTVEQMPTWRQDCLSFLNWVKVSRNFRISPISRWLSALTGSSIATIPSKIESL
jgi:hypothetical protein